jgi:cytochrome c-type biogenesis protein CcmH/NrfF
VTRRALALLLTALLTLALAAAAPAHAAVEPRTTIPDVEDEVMCVSCGVPLNVAESAQADDQRDLIADLVAEGRTKDEVKDALVAEYGERVLAVPGDDGFELAAWVLPVVLLVGGTALVALLALRWRGTTGGGGSPPAAPAAALSTADARRLDEDLARFDR